jgi:hypothetical protein
MADEIQNKQNEIQAELNSAGVSRRGFIDRVKALGFGFGAAAALGVEAAQAHNASDTSLSLKSTNPALDSIINEGGEQQGNAEQGEKKIQEAWYRRFYRRFYRRGGWGGGYRRFYRRW